MPKTFAEELYEQLAPFVRQDSDEHLWKYVQSLGHAWEDLQILIRDQTEDDVAGNHELSYLIGIPGWFILLCPNHCLNNFPQFLPWLQQIAGVIPRLNEPPQQARDRIAAAEAFKRGTPLSLYNRAFNFGATFFLLQERYNDNPWAVRILFLVAEHTPEREREVVEMIPAGITYTVGFWSGVLYSDVRDTYDTYDDIDEGTTTYADLRGD